MSKLVVAGATGLVGSAVIDEAATSVDTQIVGLSRRGGGSDGPNNVTHLAVDLGNHDSVAMASGSLEGTTHLVYTAVEEQAAPVAAWRDGAAHTSSNASMLANLLAVLRRCSPRLEQIVLLQGTKAYGTHLGAMDVPARESDPALMVPGFYSRQQRLVREFAQESGASWTVFRPTTIIGMTRSSAASILPCVAYYAAVCSELEHPLRFPGTNHRNIWQAVDVRLLARAITWSFGRPAAKNQVFNVANGDCVTWETLWYHIAEYFSLRVAPPGITSIDTLMRDKNELWRRVTALHGLQESDLESLPWQSADFHLSRDHHAFASTNKLMAAGFTETVDTIDMFLEYLEDMRESRLIP